MKITSSFILFLLPFLCLSQLKEDEKGNKTALAFANAQSEGTKNDTSLESQIFEEKYILLNGIEQWVTIKGNPSKPIILFIHGGPGSVLSPYSSNIYGEWEKEYTLVNWDQRGAGRTFGRNAPNDVDENYWIENKLSLDQMVTDGIELTEYLTKHLNKQKVILIGTSWGSILGTKMAIARPDLFFAYLGNSQFVDFDENYNYAYEKVLELAKESGDTISIQKLMLLGNPPYNDARSFGQIMRIVKKYEQVNATPAPADWWEIAPKYNNETDSKNRYNGDDYSFLYFAGHEKLGIKSMAKDVHLNKDAIEFKIPVYLIQGEKDISTASAISKPYFEKISAPDKAYYLMPDAGHGQNQSVVNRQYQILKEKLKL
jgi:pimeloyl-ACP methyl ester carboxylesterase